MTTADIAALTLAHIEAGLKMCEAAVQQLTGGQVTGDTSQACVILAAPVALRGWKDDVETALACYELWSNETGLEVLDHADRERAKVQHEIERYAHAGVIEQLARRALDAMPDLHTAEALRAALNTTQGDEDG